MKWKKAENRSNNFLDSLHMWEVVVIALSQCNYKWLLSVHIFMIFVKVDQLFTKNLPKIPENYSYTLHFREVKLNFTQPGKDQWRAHPAETKVRLNRALSHISPNSPVCTWQRWAPDRNGGDEMVKGAMTDGYHPYIPPQMHFHICLAFQGLFSYECHSETSKQVRSCTWKARKENILLGRYIGHVW